MFAVREVRFRPRLVPFRRVVTAVYGGRNAGRTSRSAGGGKSSTASVGRGSGSSRSVGKGGKGDVYRSVAERVLKSMNSPLGAYRAKPGAPAYIKVGDHVIREPKAFGNVQASGGKLTFNLNIDALKKVAALTDNGKVTIAINLNNRRSILLITVDKDGHVSVPSSEEGVVTVSGNTVTVDAVKALFGQWRPKTAQLSVWVRTKGIQGPITGQTVRFS